MLTFSDLRGTAPAATTLPLFDAPARVRTFDAPEFRGITFYEVEAKSVLNRVPAASRMPFRWTINVYRGCSHACVYCLSGDTPILMGDGRTKPLADVRVGDAVYGTVRSGSYRRYVITRVLAHWSTIKPAYRITLSDGTELTASGDHRFLTERGWKYVTGSEQGRQRRPHLTTSNKLMGTGRFPPPPKGGPEYQAGYLCGMIRGDGHVGSYTYSRPRRADGTVHRFRLALADVEALERSQTYLADLGIATTRFVFQEGTASRRRMEAIRTSTSAGVAGVRAAIGWPTEPSAEWSKGFLAGIFDAEGAFRCGESLRIFNTDQAIIDQVTASLRRLGFAYTLEVRAAKTPVTSVRLQGGLREQLRFFQTVDPAITRKRTIEGSAIKSDAPLKVVAIKPIGLDLRLFDITTGTGDFIADGVVSHNCFARPSHTYLNFNAGEDFERRVVVKVNAPEVLRRELRRRSWRGEHVAMGTNTDPYQRCEGRYRLTRGVLEALRDAANPCSVLTKSPLLLRDLDLFEELAGGAGFTANLSVGTLDETVWRRTEPGTPHPRARIAAVERLRDAGIECGVLVAPVLPGISDAPEQLRAVVHAAAAAGATHISPITLHLRPGVKEEFLGWLERDYPELMPDYQRLYPRSYAPREVRRAIGERVEAAKRTHPALAADRPPRTVRERAARLVPAPPADREEPPRQLTLDLG